MSRSRKPSVFQIGKIRDDGRTVVISGWGLGLCAQACTCHRHPLAGHLAIAEDQDGGTLGLVSFHEGGCDCCEPWTADELSAVVRDLQMVTDLDAPAGARPAVRRGHPAALWTSHCGKRWWYASHRHVTPCG